MKNTLQKGFTLAELLIVIVILAILATLAYPSYERFIRKSRLENVRSELLINAHNLERFYAQNRTFEKFPATDLVQNEYFTIQFFNYQNTQKGKENPSASGFLLEAKPNDEYKSKETCSVYLDSDGIFWASSSANSEDCPGYEHIDQK